MRVIIQQVNQQISPQANPALAEPAAPIHTTPQLKLSASLVAIDDVFDIVPDHFMPEWHDAEPACTLQPPSLAPSPIIQIAASRTVLPTLPPGSYPTTFVLAPWRAPWPISSVPTATMLRTEARQAFTVYMENMSRAPLACQAALRQLRPGLFGVPIDSLLHTWSKWARDTYGLPQEALPPLGLKFDTVKRWLRSLTCVEQRKECSLHYRDDLGVDTQGLAMLIDATTFGTLCGTLASACTRFCACVDTRCSSCPCRNTSIVTSGDSRRIKSAHLASQTREKSQTADT